MKARIYAILMCVVTTPVFAADVDKSPASTAAVDAILPQVEALYIDLHRHPELSFHEQRTAATLAEGLRKLGFDVTTGVGRLGVVGVLKNGAGPTVMLRTELDALPVKEQTGLAYASQVTTHNDAGVEVPVAHACGHDVHMSAWMGTATLLSKSRDQWKGTLVLIGQPAEESVGGAILMLKDGLFTRFPKPDYVIAFHDESQLPAGTVGYTPGYSHANVDSVDITIYGKGGHGAMPQTTVDPIVIAARTVLSLQTIVSRELDPRDPAVITVGSIHGGTKHNIIPDQVHLQLTVRSYKPETRKHLLASIERIAKAESEAGGAPKPPLVEFSDASDSVYNDPQLTGRVVAVLRRRLGNDKVVEMPPKMVAEDFSEYGKTGVPAMMFFVGAVNPARYQAAKASGERLPSLHSSQFAPDLKPTLETAIEAETAVLLDLLGKP
ncbi:MAG TPA: amidohydrolase [Terriglobales bacterium]|nr:amidohydrolase [Terriglobales bacterium]